MPRARLTTEAHPVATADMSDEELDATITEATPQTKTMRIGNRTVTVSTGVPSAGSISTAVNEKIARANPASRRRAPTFNGISIG